MNVTLIPVYSDSVLTILECIVALVDLAMKVLIVRKRLMSVKATLVDTEGNV